MAVTPEVRMAVTAESMVATAAMVVRVVAVAMVVRVVAVRVAVGMEAKLVDMAIVVARMALQMATRIVVLAVARLTQAMDRLLQPRRDGQICGEPRKRLQRT